MWRNMERGSSPVDWCEENYVMSSVVAEFANTWSNIPLCTVPLISMYLFKEYGKSVGKGIHFIWAMLVVIGLSSAYFHATLSLVGQLLDEVSIVWGFMSAFAIFYPRYLFPRVFHNDRRLFIRAACACAVLITALSLLSPEINAFLLFFMATPGFYVLQREVKKCSCARVYFLGIQSIAAALLAIFCWFNDRLFCGAWRALNFPYLHALWHVLIFFASYYCCVFFAYYTVAQECPEKKPLLKYWPKDTFGFGIPYVTVIKCARKLGKHKKPIV